MDWQAHSRQLIDRIVYLASLISEPDKVDDTLDKLRAITSQAVQPSSEDIVTLKQIKSELEYYLIHQEKLRSFTEESLRANVERNFASEDPTRAVRQAALKRIIVTIVIAGIVTAIPAALKIMQGQVILAFFVFTLFVGLAFVFQSFKKDLAVQLRGSLNYLMAAIIGTGLFALNFPIIAASDYLQGLYLNQHGGFLIGAVPVYAFYYIAFYLYAKQLGVAVPRALKPAGVILSAILVAIISIVVPHPAPVAEEFFYDLALIGFAVSVYFSSAAAILGFMTVPKTTAVYSQSTRFLAISMVLQSVGNGFFLVYVTYPSGNFMVNDQKGQILTGMLIVFALVTQYIAAYKSKTALR